MNEYRSPLPNFITFREFQSCGYFKDYTATGSVEFDTSGYGSTGEGLLCSTHEEYLIPADNGFKCPISDCQTSVLKLT